MGIMTPQQKAIEAKPVWENVSHKPDLGAWGLADGFEQLTGKPDLFQD